VFEKYLKSANIEMSFQEFEKEIMDRRDVMLTFGTLVRDDYYFRFFRIKLEQTIREFTLAVQLHP
jgi:hypothetical protein